MTEKFDASDLPHNWEYDEKTDCVVCGGCCFRYGAEHPESNGSGWLCPNCGDGNGTSEMPVNEELAKRIAELQYEAGMYKSLYDILYDIKRTPDLPKDLPADVIAAVVGGGITIDQVTKVWGLIRAALQLRDWNGLALSSLDQNSPVGWGGHLPGKIEP